MEFFFPAVRGTQGGKTFYVATVPFKMLKRLMAFDTGDVLDRSQRAVDPTRAKALSKYLIQNQSSFVLPSLTGIVDDETLVFEEFVPDSNVGKLVLSLDATIKLFDGQHRATGIMQALRDCPALQFNTVTIQLFKDMTLEERQQAFSDINANAKAVSASLNLAYNKRDEGLEMLAEQIGKVSAWKGMIDYEKNIVAKNSNMLFSYRHAVQASRLVLGIGPKDKPDPICVNQVSSWWNQIAVVVGWNFRELIAQTADDKKCIEIREATMQSVAFTAAGLLTLGRVPQMIKAKWGLSIAGWQIMEAMQKTISWNKADEMWAGNLVDAKGNMVATSAAQIAAAEAIMERITAYIESM